MGVLGGGKPWSGGKTAPPLLLGGGDGKLSSGVDSASFVLDGDWNGVFLWLGFLNPQAVIVARPGVHLRHGSLAASPYRGGLLGMQYLPGSSRRRCMIGRLEHQPAPADPPARAWCRADANTLHFSGPLRGSVGPI